MEENPDLLNYRIEANHSIFQPIEWKKSRKTFTRLSNYRRKTTCQNLFQKTMTVACTLRVGEFMGEVMEAILVKVQEIPPFPSADTLLQDKNSILSVG